VDLPHESRPFEEWPRTAGRSPLPAVWHHVFVEWDGNELERWFTAFWQSDEAGSRLRSLARRYGVVDRVDDINMNWVESMLRTCKGAGPPAWVRSEEDARAYVLRAMRYRVIDAARAETGVQPDPPDPPDPPVRTGPDVDAICDLLALEVERLDQEGELVCEGCGPKRDRLLRRLALRVIELLRDIDETLSRIVWVPSGGTTPLDKLVYLAIEIEEPNRLRTDARGRSTDASRQFKRRCTKCLEPLLANVLGRVLPA
jgi:hypothetical protein